jgi:hypothetical protein
MGDNKEQFTDVVMDDDFIGGNELNYANQLSGQMTRINYYFSRLNETPSWVFSAWSRSDNTFDPLSYKPNIDNFIKSVLCFEILLEPKMDKDYDKARDALKNPKGDDDYEYSIHKYKLLIQLVYRADLLPSDRVYK